MRHVDDGTIHTWLDEQITDPAEAAWVEEHFRTCGACRTRLAAERATFDRAQGLLAGTAPSVERPPFEALVARAGHLSPGSETAFVARLTHGRRERLLFQAGWAASIALAVGLGWTARELTGRDSLRPDPAPAMAGQSAATTPATAKPAEPSRPMAEPVTGAGVSNVPNADAPGRQRTDAESRFVDVTTPTAQPQALRQTAAVAPQRTETDTQAESSARAEERGRSSPTTGTPRAAPPPAAVPVSAAAPRQEAIGVTGETAATTALPVDTEWRTLPRTEAAARTGMPLYGIDGLEPVLTALSADGTIVRTMYRLASGEDVELVQQRAAPDVPGSVAPIEATRRAFAGAGRAGIVVDQLAAARRTWSIVRGDVRVTLRTASDAADLDALGTRLRVD